MDLKEFNSYIERNGGEASDKLTFLCIDDEGNTKLTNSTDIHIDEESGEIIVVISEGDLTDEYDEVLGY